jgi:hypothetical protein
LGTVQAAATAGKVLIGVISENQTGNLIIYVKRIFYSFQLAKKSEIDLTNLVFEE